MSGILGKIAGIGSTIKSMPGVAGNMIKRAGGAAVDFVKNNAETIEKVGGAALGAGLKTFAPGFVQPLISGANSLIQSLPDNDFTKHLKTFSNAVSGGGTYENQDPTEPKVDTRSNQTNAVTEYRSVLPSHFTQFPSHFTQFPSHFTQSPMYSRAVNKVYDKMSSKRQKGKTQKARVKRQKSKGKR